MPDMIDLMGEGIDGNLNKLKSPLSNLASALIPGTQMTSVPVSEGNGGSGASSADMAELTQAVLKYLPKMANQQIVLDSGILVGELAGGLNRQLGKAYL